MSGTEEAMPRRQARAEPFFAPEELYLFNEGRLFQAYERFGAHLLPGGERAAFAIWAPNAEEVSVVHDGNGWQPGVDLLEPQGSSGIFAGELSGVSAGTKYKYRIVPRDGRPREKADPYAFQSECPPASASVLADLDYKWGDDAWMAERSAHQGPDRPLN